MHQRQKMALIEFAEVAMAEQRQSKDFLSRDMDRDASGPCRRAEQIQQPTMQRFLLDLDASGESCIV